MEFIKWANSMKFGYYFGPFLSLFFLATTLQSQDQQYIHPSLKQWSRWVQDKYPEHACPKHLNSKQRLCSFPSQLQLDITSTGARFTYQVKLFNSGKIKLPGSRDNWPFSVIKKGRTIPVVGQDTPTVWLPAGQHNISGVFKWKKRPNYLQLPPRLAMLDLRIDKKRISFPQRDRAGKLWFQQIEQVQTDKQVSNHLDFRVYRRLRDHVPMEIDTHLILDISGQEREIKIGPAILPQTEILSFSSKLPAYINKHGFLVMHGKPGTWTVDFTSRTHGPLAELKLPEVGLFWAKEEIWSFQAKHSIRTVTIKGPPSLDPHTTQMPRGWKKLPAYSMTSGTVMIFAENKRGLTVLEKNNLSLNRSLWLDFAGNGYTFHDQLKGKMARDWRLEMIAPYSLGRVDINKKPQFITRLYPQSPAGIEVRKEVINLTADGRIDKFTTLLPVTGWNQNLKKALIKLHLPLQWSVLYITGADDVKGDLIGKWNLGLLFLTFLIGFALVRLFGIFFGIVGGLTMLLTLTEHHAPAFLWLNLLVVISLLKILPASRITKFLKTYHILSLILLFVSVFEFVSWQITGVFYPTANQARFSNPFQSFAPAPMNDHFQKVDAEMEIMEQAVRSEKKKFSPRKLSKGANLLSNQVAQSSYGGNYRKTSIPKQQQLKIQTGPGLPSWKWNTLNIKWQGPVKTGDQINIFYLSPAVNNTLAFVRIALVLFLFFLLILKTPFFKPWNQQPVLTNAILIFSLFSLWNPSQLKANYPPKYLLDDLEKRFTANHLCKEHCVSIEKMTLKQSGINLKIILKVHSEAHAILPIPSNPFQWMPAQILKNGRGQIALSKNERGSLLLVVEKGVHTVILSGALPSQNKVEIELLVPPKLFEADTKEWKLKGLNQNGHPQGDLILVRSSKEKELQANEEKRKALQTQIPPYFQITRQFYLDVSWRIHTIIERQSASDEAVELKLKLLPGEAVLTEGVKVRGGIATVNIPSSRYRTLIIKSRLKPSNKLMLEASKDKSTKEIWQFYPSSFWNLTFSGIVATSHVSNGIYTSRWNPFPGEEITVNILKPEGVKGETLTVKKSNLIIEPGLRSSDGHLELKINSSLGGKYHLELPSKTEVISLRVNGEKVLQDNKKQKLSIPLRPNENTIKIHWRQNTPITSWFSSPTFKLLSSSTNNHLTVKVPPNRWILWVSGPKVGPALLYWGKLIVLLLLALVMGQYFNTMIKTPSWILLYLGMSLSSPWFILWITGFFVLIGLYKNYLPKEKPWLYNLGQILMIGAFASSILILISIIYDGFFSSIKMPILGNNSSARVLNWYVDRNQGQFPQGNIFWLNIWWFKSLMMLWALWFSHSLTKWLPKIWTEFQQNGIFQAWKKKKPTSKK